MKLITADHLVPASGPPIRDGGVLISDGRIAAVGRSDELRRQAPDAPAEHFASSAIMPGFVNCHSHLELTALRGLLDDLDHDFRAWLLKLTRLREDVLTEEDIRDSALAGAAEGIRSGVTCFGDIGRWGVAGFEAIRASGLRGTLFQETEFSPGDRTAGDDCRKLLEKVVPLSESVTELVKVGISPHSPYTVSRELFGRILDLARKLSLPVSIHAAESEDEQALLTRGEGFFAQVYSDFGIEWRAPGMRAVEYLASTGILETGPLLAHCTKADAAEIALLASSGSSVAHCPKSNAKFGHGTAPLARFTEAGVKVGLGTDSMVSNNVCDMIEEARFASLAARIKSPRDPFIQPSEAIRMATLGGAEAMGIDAETGSLEPGKSADLIAVSLAEVSRLPVNDVESAILFASRASDVTMTMVAGEEIFRDGRLARIDEERLRVRMVEIGDRLSKAKA